MGFNLGFKGLTSTTHQLESCEHSRASLEAFKRGKKLVSIKPQLHVQPTAKVTTLTMPLLLLLHCCQTLKSLSIPTADLPQPKKYSGLK